MVEFDLGSNSLYNFYQFLRWAGLRPEVRAGGFGIDFYWKDGHHLCTLPRRFMAEQPRQAWIARIMDCIEVQTASG